jgi:hypothetical protein
MSREILSYTISNAVSGHCLGVYEGTSRDDALDTLARAAGYDDYFDACASGFDGDDLIVIEIESAA